MSKSQFDCRTSPQDEMEIGEGRLKIEIFYTDCLLPRWFDWFYFRMFAFKIFSQRFNWLCFYYTFWTHLFVVDSRHCFLILHDRCDKWWSLLVTACSLVIVGWGLSNVVMTGDPDTPGGWGQAEAEYWHLAGGMQGTMTWIRCHRWGGALANPWGHFCQV